MLTAIYKLIMARGKQIVLAVAMLFLLAASYAAGWWHEHDKLVAYKATVYQAAADQAQRTDEIIKRHNQATEAIHEDYKSRIKRLHANYANRLRNANSSCAMPTTAATTSRVDDAAVDSRSLTTPEIIERCALVTLQLEELQQWVEQTR